MRFRFGRRKEQKDVRQDSRELSEPIDSAQNATASGNSSDATRFNQEELLHILPTDKIAKRLRILVFGDTEETGNLYTLFLRSRGYEVLHFPVPSTCTLLTMKSCSCARDHICADVFLVDIDMEGMTGLEFIRHQKESGCRAQPRNKAILAKKLTYQQEREILELGCMAFRKPFRLKDLVAWVNSIEKSIPEDRELISCSELLRT